MEPCFCFIRQSYFIKNNNFIKMLDCGNTEKQSRRTHLCIKIEKDGNLKNLPHGYYFQGDFLRKYIYFIKRKEISP